MRRWWRENPLSSEDQFLLEALCEAHYESSFRPNVSSVTVANTAAGSCDVAKAIAAGILTLGGNHGPVEDTYNFLALNRPASAVYSMISSGTKIPGWGNSFIKDGPDPMWSTVDKALRKFYPSIGETVDAVTAELHHHGKDIWPNPSAYTAAVAIALAIPGKVAVYVIISARLDAWAALAYNQLEK